MSLRKPIVLCAVALFVLAAVFGCRSMRDFRPPYHEPVAAAAGR